MVACEGMRTSIVEARQGSGALLNFCYPLVIFEDPGLCTEPGSSKLLCTEAVIGDTAASLPLSTFSGKLRDVVARLRAFYEDRRRLQLTNKDDYGRVGCYLQPFMGRIVMWQERKHLRPPGWPSDRTFIMAPNRCAFDEQLDSAMVLRTSEREAAEAGYRAQLKKAFQSYGVLQRFSTPSKSSRELKKAFHSYNVLRRYSNPPLSSRSRTAHERRPDSAMVLRTSERYAADAGQQAQSSRRPSNPMGVLSCSAIREGFDVPRDGDARLSGICYNSASAPKGAMPNDWIAEPAPTVLGVPLSEQQERHDISRPSLSHPVSSSTASKERLGTPQANLTLYTLKKNSSRYSGASSETRRTLPFFDPFTPRRGTYGGSDLEASFTARHHEYLTDMCRLIQEPGIDEFHRHDTSTTRCTLESCGTMSGERTSQEQSSSVQPVSKQAAKVQLDGDHCGTKCYSGERPADWRPSSEKSDSEPTSHAAQRAAQQTASRGTSGSITRVERPGSTVESEGSATEWMKAFGFPADEVATALGGSVSGISRSDLNLEHDPWKCFVPRHCELKTLMPWVSYRETRDEARCGGRSLMVGGQNYSYLLNQRYWHSESMDAWKAFWDSSARAGMSCDIDYDNEIWVVDHPSVAGAIPDLRSDEAGRVLLVSGLAAGVTGERCRSIPKAFVILSWLHAGLAACGAVSPHNEKTRAEISLKAFNSSVVEDLGSHGERLSGTTPAEAALYRYILLLKEYLFLNRELPGGLRVLNGWGLNRLQDLRPYRIPEDGWHDQEISDQEWAKLWRSRRVQGGMPALHWSRRSPVQLSQALTCNGGGPTTRGNQGPFGSVWKKT
ncbi:hypothetical protein FOZ62_000875 [Perkinsus olseni]|uniref:Uncharacterized protein n=1 Tax=Perkinsus olseni TaxID=32597 RepID=A0A7J6Q8Z2_PEROL|nr:hypothetical protein FOZ62_000875 [Perkinsus olseni]